MGLDVKHVFASTLITVGRKYQLRFLGSTRAKWHLNVSHDLAIVLCPH